MKVYLDLVVLLNFAVNYGLLRMTAQLTGARAGPWRLGAGAAVGALYAGACVLPGLGFLAGNLWRVVFLGLMVTAAFGSTGAMTAVSSAMVRSALQRAV